MLEQLPDLEALLDLPLAVTIGGREVEVRSIRMREIAGIWALAGQVGPALALADTVTLTILLRPEFVTFLAAAASVDRDWLAAQSNEDLLALFVAVRQQNVPLFPLPGDGEARAQAVGQSGATPTWADLISVLVAKGHKLDRIPDYGLAQFAAFLQSPSSGGAPPVHKPPVLRIVKP